ncbi:Intracellular multiplication protein IcmX [Legionella spiritensis]|nr:Intracellular multiplication protein IcmX [Legionella spiritensis]
MSRKKLHRKIWPGLLLLASTTAFAQGPYDPNNTQNSLDNINQYLLNLGEYLGYDLTNFCPQTGGACNARQNRASFTNFLLNAATASGNEVNLMVSVLGALLPTQASGGSGENQQTFQLLPNTGSNLADYANFFTNYANKTFPQYSSPSSSTVSVSNLIDQQPYQNDPVSQAVLNILSTPDASYCTNPGNGYFYPCYTGENNSNKNGGGPILSEYQVMMNVIGDPPPATGYYPLPASNQQLVSQLSSDSLLGPLMFNTASQTNNSTSNSSTTGLTANNQIQQAANFIRYAIGSVAPLVQVNRKAYDDLYAQAINASGKVPIDEQAKAKTQLSNYLANLRVYAAQTSVGISNLYYILSKRMPQNSASQSNQQTSQQLSEFQMATWRLYSPNSQNNNQQWITQINQASSATVQKEIAILLAEINYQLYLNRQQQERLLLTESILLLQNSKGTQPNENFGATDDSVSDSSSGS